MKDTTLKIESLLEAAMTALRENGYVMSMSYTDPNDLYGPIIVKSIAGPEDDELIESAIAVQIAEQATQNDWPEDELAKYMGHLTFQVFKLVMAARYGDGDIGPIAEEIGRPKLHVLPKKQKRSEADNPDSGEE